MHRDLLIAVVGGCLVIGAVAGTAGAYSGVETQQNVDPDDVLLSIAVEDDGDAAWSVEYRMRLATDEDEAAFEDLRADIESDPEPYTDRFHSRMNATADSAAEATGREMSITDVSVTAEKRELPREYGVVTYSFRWSNFATAEGDRLQVGDAIDGLFLDEDTSLLISWSETYALADASPTPAETREASVTYNGPTNFASGDPRIVLAPPDAMPRDDVDRSATILPVSPAVTGAVLVVLVTIGTGAVVAYRRQGSPLPLGGDTTGGEGPTDGGSVSGSVDPAPDAELLSTEEQVLQLIEQHGGRMKQQAIADELGWTDAKTSQVTKKLRENGDLEDFRLGRENVLTLPDESED